MKRAIPDIINCKPLENFTQIRNGILRDPNISFKAKGLLALLLSNKDGWYSYSETIKRFSTDGDTAIRSALKELEENEYLLRLKYRDKNNKKIKGGFWAYTDLKGEFDLESTFNILEDNNMELMPRNTEFPTCGECTRGKPKTNNINIKNTNYSSSVSVNSEFTEKEVKYKEIIKEQIKEVIVIPEMIELTSPLFIREMANYSPTKKELEYFIENFTEQPLEYYKEYLIWSILEEKLFSPNSNEFIIPRIALLNKNVARRNHLYFAMENSEDIMFTLKSIIKEEKEMLDKKEKEEFLKNKESFTEFVENNDEIIDSEEEKPAQIEFEFLKNIHKLDDKNLDYISEEQLDDFIEDLLCNS